MTETTPIFDFDNHYYEAEDAFTRHQDKALRTRGVRWADIDGRRRLIVGGKVNSYVANPTFDPWPGPGASTTGTGAIPTSSPSSRRSVSSSRSGRSTATRRPGWRSMDEQEVAGHPALPDARRGPRGRAAGRPRGRRRGLLRLQPVAGRGLGLSPTRVGSSLSPTSSCWTRRPPSPSCARSSSGGASSSTCATPRCPCPAATARRSIPGTTRSGAWPPTPGSSWPPTPATTATTRSIQMWEPGGAESSLFRSPAAQRRHQEPGGQRLLRHGDLPQGLRAVPDPAPGQRRERGVVDPRPAPPPRRRRQPQPRLLRRAPDARPSVSTSG